MKDYQKAFIESAINAQALCFGEFQLKSGRISPYFFNAGLLYTGETLSVLAKSYAQAIVDAGFEFDVIFGPAYKGISLGALTAAALYDEHQLNVPFTYNRKEKKDHGEGGILVGADIKGKRVLIIDDVITAGTAIREVTDILASQDASLAGVVIGLDRQEKGQGSLSAVQEVERDFDVNVASIIKLQHVIGYLEAQSSSDSVVVASIREYRQSFGIEE